MDKQDELIRAYATLKALRTNIDKMKEYSIEEKYVIEFHNVLSKLEGVGINTAEFRIPDSEVKPQVRAWVGDVTKYSEEKYIHRPYLLTKIDTVLGYFEIITSEKPKKIGFIKSDE